MKRATIALLAALFAMSLAVPVPAEEPPAKKFGPNVGDFLKEFKLKEPVEGKDYTLDAFTKTGKDTIFVFMQSACSLCRAEVNDFLESKDDYMGKVNVAFVSVDIDEARIKPYKENNKIPFPVLSDKEANLLDSAAFNSTPATLIIDAQGKIKDKMTGYDKAKVKTLLKAYMK